MNTKKTPLALIIVDGFGYSPNREGNAIALAQTPYYDEIQGKFPQTLLEASGLRVGLPRDVIGNSEVGHLNIGTGRVIETDLVRIDNAIESGVFFENQNLIEAFDNAKNKDKPLHLLGLVSDGQVHSSQEHLFALLRMAKKRGLKKVFVHAFLDGRDVSPTSAHIYLEALELKMQDIGVGKIASVCGRFYAMDRDNRWERTARAYTMLVHGEGERTFDAIFAVRNSYQRGVTDEFVEPIVVEEREGFSLATIRDGDSMVFFNFRADRARQLVRALTVRGFNEPFAVYKPKTHSVCITQYDKEFKLPVVFEPITNKNVLADVFANNNVMNYRFAETEKYAHVTYFFNGGIEKEFACENRLLLPSAKVKTYDLEPEMSAFKITDKVLRAIEARETDVFIINFANCDMVGHTGRLEKTIEAVQYVDTCLGWITKGIKSAGGTTLLTSDHGNCEQMLDLRTGEPHTAHTTNLVPFHIIGREYEGAKLREDAALCDVAPTILNLLNIEKPVEMTGKSLLEI